MTHEITFDSAPDLKRIYASAVVTGRGTTGEVPDTRAVRRGVRIELDNLVDYSRLCGFGVGTALPVTYPHLLAFPLQMAVMSQRAFPLPLLGAVHVTNVITTVRPIAVDEELDLTVHAETLRPHRRGRQVDLVSEARVGDELVWRGVSTYLARGASHPDADTSEAPSLESLEAVSSGPSWRLGEGTGRSYAAVSGDWNPIHVHALTAKPLGFPTAIAHGMYTYAKVLAALGPALPDAGVTSRVWFHKPVRLPSTVRLRSHITTGSTLSVLESGRREIEHAIVENTW
ncbi:MAG: MaoC/PaaZ C-terminal domain-containing protein [Dermatophilaceae bacterium]